MGQHSEQWWSLESVIGPALPRSTPKFKEITQACSRDKDQPGYPEISGSEDKEGAQQYS